MMDDSRGKFEREGGTGRGCGEGVCEGVCDV